MNNESGKRLWESDSGLPELRRPKHVDNAHEDKSNKDKPTNNLSSIPDVAKNSKLSVEAKEWYPPGYLNSSSVSTDNYSSARSNSVFNHSVQDRLNKYRQPENNFQNETESDLNEDMSYLDDIIRTLTKSPGEFDDLVYVLLEFLKPKFKDLKVISKVTSAIFQQALTVPNFQYSGVRLFAVLDENCPLTRGCLHTLCEEELETTTNLQNVLLFYAEIYSKLNYELFGKSLLKALKNLKPSAENVKNICQTLKITGAKLENLDKSLITELINQLENLRPSLSSSMSFLVESVIKLRNCQWGQSDIQTVTPPAEPYEWTDGPVFYGPDGMELTSEESEFLAENLNDIIIDDGDPDGLWNPEQEMDEEIQAAFAEFVRSNNR